MGLDAGNPGSPVHSMAAAKKGTTKTRPRRKSSASPYSCRVFGAVGRIFQRRRRRRGWELALCHKVPIPAPLSHGVSTYGRPYQIRFLHFPCHHLCGFLFRACVKPLQSSSGRRTRPLLGDCSLFDARFCGFPFRGFSCFLAVRAGSAAAMRPPRTSAARKITHFTESQKRAAPLKDNRAPGRFQRPALSNRYNHQLAEWGSIAMIKSKALESSLPVTAPR